MIDAVAAALGKATGALRDAEDRPSQRDMAEAVAEAISERHHLIVQAGTGTGKSLAYMVPALALGARVVVSTATKALQDQLATRDLPALAESLGVPFEFAVLKGRSNYACRQRVRELRGGGDQLSLEPALFDAGTGSPTGAGAPGAPAAGSAWSDAGLGALGREVKRLAAWAENAATSGDRAELDFEPSDLAWAQVSVTYRDCPGAGRCPSGADCFAERAREAASLADVVVVNTHLYVTSLVSEGELLSAHDVVVFDEAHELEDIATASLGVELGGGRFASVGRMCRALLDDPAAALAVEECAGIFADVTGAWLGQAIPRPLEAGVADRMTMIRERLAHLGAELRRASRSLGGETAGGGALPQTASGGSPAASSARFSRAEQALGHLQGDFETLLGASGDDVAWVEDTPHGPLARLAPLDVGARLSELMWSKQDAPTAILTSATIPPRMAERVGLSTGTFDQRDVGSPFAYDEQALLYCPLHLPDPRDPAFEGAMHDELVALIEAARGRTLALFTSWRAMRLAATEVSRRVEWEVLTQSDLPKPALVARFASRETSCLFATMGFWQGVDVPGSSLSLVTIDRIPFSRPDDPLLLARRAKAGKGAFELIDLPRAAAMLAQGTGRLIRSRSDRGVVAVLDTRLARARYRWALIGALPPMRRTRHLSEVEAFLAGTRDAAEPAGKPAQ
ncbi:MAG: ATP-dependent DNA helicase [Acidimicrobiales bacterium]